MHSRKMQKNERLFKKGKMWYGKTQSQEFDCFLLVGHAFDFQTKFIFSRASLLHQEIETKYKTTM